jgi:hypothetical protein
LLSRRISNGRTELFGFGSNKHHELGIIPHYADKKTRLTHIPTKNVVELKQYSKIEQVVCGLHFTVFITGLPSSLPTNMVDTNQFFGTGVITGTKVFTKMEFTCPAKVHTLKTHASTLLVLTGE